MCTCRICYVKNIQTTIDSWAGNIYFHHIDPESKLLRRHHIDEKQLLRAVKKAAFDANINKHVTPHTLRNSFTTHLLQSCAEIRTVQIQLGHLDVRTTQIYTHVLQQGANGVISPFSRL